MRVLCINATFRQDEFDGPNVKEGEIYHVIDEVIGFGTTGKVYKCYVLEEIGKNWAYDQDKFIPLSDIDETDMKRNYKKEELTV